MVNFKRYLIFFVLFFLLRNPLSAEEKILAIVNQEVITTKDLNDFINFLTLYQPETENLESKKQQLLKKLIEDKLLLQEAKRQNINIDKNLLEDRIKEIRKRYPNDIEFQQALNQQGLTLADIEKRITEQMLIYNVVEKNVKSKIFIHPQEVNEFYQAHKDEFMEPEKREIFVLIFDSKPETEDLKIKLENEGPEGLKKEPYLTIKELGLIEKAQLKPEFDKAIFSLKEKEISQVIEHEGKFYIFFVNKIIPEQQKPFSEVKYKIYDILFEKKLNEKLDSWLDELRKKSYIQIK